MSNRTATVNARIDPEVKKAAEEVLDKVGLSASDAINVFYRQIVYANGLPFEVKASKAGAPIELFLFFFALQNTLFTNICICN